MGVNFANIYSRSDPWFDTCYEKLNSKLGGAQNYPLRGVFTVVLPQRKQAFPPVNHPVLPPSPPTRSGRENYPGKNIPESLHAMKTRLPCDTLWYPPSRHVCCGFTWRRWQDLV